MTVQLKTTRIILINNINNFFQQLARQSTPCRAQGQQQLTPNINQTKFQNYEQESDSICYGSTRCMASYEKPSINTRVYGTMGEYVPTTIVRGGRRIVAVWVCVSCDV